MIVLFLLDAGLALLGLVLAIFPALPSFDYPDAPSLGVPVPYLSDAQIAAMNVWLAVALPVGVALIFGRVIQWAYRLIPLKAT